MSFWIGNMVRIFGLFDFFDFLELMEEIEVLVWWRWPEVWEEVVVWMLVRALI